MTRLERELLAILFDQLGSLQCNFNDLVVHTFWTLSKTSAWINLASRLLSAVPAAMSHFDPSKQPMARKQLAFWREARRRLKRVECEPPITRERSERLQAALPARPQGESLENWLRRLRSGVSTKVSNTIPFRAQPQWQFTPLVVITRLAADSGGAEIRLPDPGRALETDDGRFRLTLSAEAGKICIIVETLGGAIAALANQRLGIAGPGGEEELLAIIMLDEDGDGSAEVDDSLAIRRALLQPVIGLIEDAVRRG